MPFVPRAVISRARVLPYICDACLCNGPLPRSGARLATARRIHDAAAVAYTTRTLASTSVKDFRPGSIYPSKASRNLGRFTRLSKSYRSYSASAAASTPTSSPAPAGITPLPNRRLISLTGSETAKFLQGLVTNNVDATNFDPFYTAFLDARGRVLWDAFVYPKEKDGEWGCLVEVDADEVPSVLKHLKKHRLRKKIAIEALGEEDGISVWAGWGPEITSYLEKLRADKRTVAIMADPRAEEPTTMDPFAYRFIVKGEAPLATDTLPILDLEEYRTRRYIYGVPEGPTELPREAALPMEHNIDLASGIDFKKGCYMGQELTIRTKHTGVVRKRVLPVQLYRGGENVGVAMDTGSGDGTPKFDPNWQGPVDLAEGPLDIKQLDDEGGIKKGRSLGKLIARTGNVGLALCRLENMTPWRITAEGGSYTPGAEFGVQTSNAEEQPVRVKAFLPQWLMARQKEIWHKAKPKERTM